MIRTSRSRNRSNSNPMMVEELEGRQLLSVTLAHIPLFFNHGPKPPEHHERWHFCDTGTGTYVKVTPNPITVMHGGVTVRINIQSLTRASELPQYPGQMRCNIGSGVDGNTPVPGLTVTRETTGMAVGSGQEMWGVAASVTVPTGTYTLRVVVNKDETSEAAINVKVTVSLMALS